jgi:hypothetical protein
VVIIYPAFSIGWRMTVFRRSGAVRLGSLQLPILPSFVWAWLDFYPGSVIY